ncbi:MAG: inositol monophosphatase [Planctomycetes bacterium]|nr:inositol monophosphatase [Planctomycetota bacterium]
MRPDPHELGTYLREAEAIARAGGAVLAEHATRLAEMRTEFKGRRELVTEADRATERAVVERLLARFPEHAVLAEEGVLTPRGLPHRASEWTWILDPLDGTTNFVHGIPFYCVALALAFQGDPVLGVVHAPALGHTYAAARGCGALRNGAPIQVSATADLRDALLCTGFSYNRNEPGRDDNSARLARVLPACRDLRRLGSAELDLCLTAAGHYDGYWEMYLMPYDVAAGAVVVQEAGGRVTDLDGGQAWLHGASILASNGRLHDPLRALVGPAPRA